MPTESVAQAENDEPGTQQDETDPTTSNRDIEADGETCVVELEWPNVDEQASDGCYRWPTLTQMANPRVVYPCGGGEGTLEGEMTSKATSLDAVDVEVDGRHLTLEAHSSPYIIYGCLTSLVKRLDGNLDTGVATYEYDEEWSEPEHCQKSCSLELEGQFIRR